MNAVERQAVITMLVALRRGLLALAEGIEAGVKLLKQQSI
jgi:hypothetical protein